MAVKAPFGPSSVFARAFSPTPDSPWPHLASATATPSALHASMSLPESSIDSRLAAAVPNHDTVLTPQELVAPSPSTSETGTIFTDVDGPEEDHPTAVHPTSAIEAEYQKGAIVKTPSRSLTINTGFPATKPPPPVVEDEIEPQSVIHIPSGFGMFHGVNETNPRQNGRSSVGQAARPQSSLSHVASVSASSEASVPSDNASSISHDSASSMSYDSEATAETAIPLSSVSSSFQSDSTVKDEQPEMERSNEFYDNIKVPPSPLQTSIPSVNDWTSTPRAQTRQEVAAFSRPGSSLASITEGDDYVDSDHLTTDPSADEDERRRSHRFYRSPDSEIKALKAALSECWTLCNTLASLSHIHRERIFTNHSGKGDMQEQAWKSCWKLCQNLYETRDDVAVVSARPTLDLCRDFCQALFEVRVRTNEPADSVLRVSFELNNHLFNTHDRTLPEAFRERTLDFYITLCHRLMKQRSKLAEETDSLLKACWSLAEMLFSLRQSKREGRQPEEELLGSAVQACWELCDLFREGWTQVRPDRGTPKPSQTTFSQAFQQAKRAGFVAVDENGAFKLTPETPTTIFDDNVTVSPDDPPVPNIMVLNNEHLSVPQSAKSTASAPPSLPRPNSTQRMTRPHSHSRERRWTSLNSVMSADEDSSNELQSAVSAASRASTNISMTSSVHTIRTPAEDPGMTLLKALFVRAAVQSDKGFNPDPRTSQQGTASSLPLFARSLPENAFGNQAWQKNLLEHFRRTIQNDSTFRSLGNLIAITGVGLDPTKGREEIAVAVRGMTTATYGWSWLKDLFRYGYGLHIDDAIQKSKDETSTRDVNKNASRKTTP